MTLRIDSVLVSPNVTEKTTRTPGVYSFYVHNDATKHDIKNAVESFYGVVVDKVRVISTRAKHKMGKGGRPVVKRAERKKALVTLGADQVLDFNSLQ
jgi:large subunit ribosomal protein L23